MEATHIVTADDIMMDLQAFVTELLRTVAYIAMRHKEGTVRYDILQADLSSPTSKYNVLQEIGW